MRTAFALALLCALAAPCAALEITPPEPSGQWTRNTLVSIMAGAGSMEAERKIYDDFQPDLLEWHHGIYHNRGDFFTRRGVRVSGGAWEREYQEFVTWYDRDWRRRMGQFHDNGVTRRFDGAPVWDGRPRYCASMCHKAPKWHMWHNQGLLRPVPFADSISQDNIDVAGFQFGRGAFCKWCLAGFRDYLAKRFPTAQLKQMGVEPVDEFDFVAYVNGRGLKRDPTILEDPVAREYVKYQYVWHLEQWQEAVRQVKDEARRLGRPIPPVYGNQYHASYVPFGAMQSGSVDVVWSEEGTYLPFPGSGKQAWSTLRYKAGEATGDFQRPCWTCVYPKNAAQWRIIWAEAQANGGMSTYNPPSEAYKAYAEWLRANRHLFCDRRRVAKVAILYSITSSMWNQFPGLGIRSKQTREAVAALARALEEAHIPYEVICDFHPQLRDNSAQYARYARYQTILAPFAECVGEATLERIRKYERDGGKFTPIGPFATYDEDHVLREPKAPQGPADGAEAISAILNVGSPDDPERAHAITTLASLAQPTQQAGLLKLDAPSTVWANLWRHPGRLALHLVNYDLDGDAITSAQDIKCEVWAPEGLEFTQLWLDSPDFDREQIDFQRDRSTVTFSIPRIEHYVIASLTVPGEMEAAQAIAQARSAVDRLRVSCISRQWPAGEAPYVRPEELDVTPYEEQLAQSLSLHQANDYEQAGSKAASVKQAADKALRNWIAETEGRERANLARWTERGATARLAFDCGPGNTPDGFKPLRADTTYDPQRGFGWLETEAISATAGETPNAIWGDFLSCEFPRTLRIDLQPGTYLVTIMTGESNTSYHWDSLIDVTCNGEMTLVGVPRRGDIFRTDGFVARAPDGRLDLTFSARPSWETETHDHAWSLNGLVVEPKDRQRTDNRSLPLRDWLVIGPFDGSDWQGLDTAFPPEVELQAGYGDLAWRRVSATPGIPVLDCRAILGGDDESVYFALTEIIAQQDTVATLARGLQSRAKVWLNGEEILRDIRAAGLTPDEYQEGVRLRKGRNTLLVKLTTDWIGAALVGVLRGDTDPPGVSVTAERLATQWTAAPAYCLPSPQIYCDPAELDLGRSVAVRVAWTNATPIEQTVRLDLEAESQPQDALRVERAGAAEPERLAPGATATARFAATMLKPVAGVEHWHAWRLDVPDRVKLIAHASVGDQTREARRWLPANSPHLAVSTLRCDPTAGAATIAATVTNTSRHELEGRVEFEPPAGWRADKEREELRLKGREKRSVEVALNLEAEAEAGEYPVKVTLDIDTPQGGAVRLTDTAFVSIGGLVGKWDFEEGEGPIARDTSGEGNDARFAGGRIRWVEGRRGKGIHTEGYDHLAAPHSRSLDITQGVTVACWVKPDRFVGNDIILAKTDNYNEYLLYCDGSGTLRGRIRHRGAGARYQDALSSPEPLKVGRWQHIAMTWSRSGMNLFVNGKAVAHRKATQPAIGDVQAPFIIGGGSYDGGFTGAIDEVRVFNYALASEDVAGLAGD